MTYDTLNGLRLADAAAEALVGVTEGPWVVSDIQGCGVCTVDAMRPDMVPYNIGGITVRGPAFHPICTLSWNEIDGETAEAHASLFAYARNHLPALEADHRAAIDEVERLRIENARLTAPLGDEEGK